MSKVADLLSKNFLPISLFIIFLVAYCILGFVRHSHYQSFGYDLGINDQVVWRYAHLQSPLTTIDPFPDKTKFAEHIEIVYILIAPIYWIYSSAYTLIFVQALIFCSSSLAVYLLARRYKLSKFVSLVVMTTYLMFYGVQFGLWTDVHSSIFAAGFLMWFIYLVDKSKKNLSILFFFLTLTAKESTGTALFCISLVYFLYRREKRLIFFMSTSVLYMLFVFCVFYPYIMHQSYLYSNHNGFLSNLDPRSLVDTSQKRSTIFYSFASWGFLPILSPVWLIPVVSHFYKYFVVASDLVSTQGIFGQYRIMLAPVLAQASIWTIKRFYNRFPRSQIYFGIWLLATCLLAQYFLHLPLSYLSKSWFWAEPSSMTSINKMIAYLPSNASIVSQNNITPHISQRDKIYTLYPEKKMFEDNSLCGQKICNWFRWDGEPKYLIVDESVEWDARHLLTDNGQFLKGLQNLEKAKIIVKYKEIGTTVLYAVQTNPSDYKSN